MRETFGSLLKTSQNYVIDDTATTVTALSSTETFLKSEINKTVRYMFSRIKNYKTQSLPRTMTTVADQIYYSYPADVHSIESVTMTVGDVDYPLQVVNSQSEWDRLQLIEIASSTIPKYFFPRQRDFGIYPTPSDAYTVTMVINPLPVNMTASDYTAGTVTVGANTRTVTGSSTTFTSAMVGRWFKANSDGLWYQISAFGSTTSLTLQNYFENGVSSDSYVIGESPNIPEELHELIPYRVAGNYFQTQRRDPGMAQKYMNFFYTGDYDNPKRSGSIHGGFLGVLNEYKTKGRANNNLVQMGKPRFNYHDERWAITLSE